MINLNFVSKHDFFHLKTWLYSIATESSDLDWFWLQCRNCYRYNHYMEFMSLAHSLVQTARFRAKSWTNICWHLICLMLSLCFSTSRVRKNCLYHGTSVTYERFVVKSARLGSSSVFTNYRDLPRFVETEAKNDTSSFSLFASLIRSDRSLNPTYLIRDYDD